MPWRGSPRQAGIGTFRGPFIGTGNGFFASWLGLVACIYATVPYLPKDMQVVGRQSQADTKTVEVKIGQ